VLAIKQLYATHYFQTALDLSMDEFDGGYRPDQRYDRRPEDSKVKQFDLWGVIAGDGTWRRSAYALQELLK